MQIFRPRGAHTIMRCSAPLHAHAHTHTSLLHHHERDVKIHRINCRQHVAIGFVLRSEPFGLRLVQTPSKFQRDGDQRSVLVVSILVLSCQQSSCETKHTCSTPDRCRCSALNTTQRHCAEFSISVPLERWMHAPRQPIRIPQSLREGACRWHLVLDTLDTRSLVSYSISTCTSRLPGLHALCLGLKGACNCML